MPINPFKVLGHRAFPSCVAACPRRPLAVMDGLHEAASRVVARRVRQLGLDDDPLNDLADELLAVGIGGRRCGLQRQDVRGSRPLCLGTRARLLR